MFGFTIIQDDTVAASGLTQAMIESVEDVLGAALDYWGRYIEAPNANIEIGLSLESLGSDSLGSATPLYGSFNPPFGPFIDVVNEELTTNADNGPFDVDARLTINLDLINNGSFFFDTTYEPNPAGLAAEQSDLLTVLTAQVGRILGFIGDFSIFDSTMFTDNTIVIGNDTFFAGENAVAANGGQNVQVEGAFFGGRPTGSIDGIGDLLSSTLITGERLPINPVHIGILEDLGLTIVEESTGDDVLHGFEEFDDDINGLAGDDVLFGYSGDDSLSGSGGDDTLNGGLGDDVLIGGSGNDVINGGDGIDQARYADSTAAVTIDLNAGTASGGDAEGDTFVSIEDVSGSDFDDRLTGNTGDNVLRGFDGDDRLFGLSGDDTLRGHAGEDFFSGSIGADTIFGGEGDDLAFGGADNDILNGDEGADELRGGSGDDIINGGIGEDLLIGQNGNDTLNGGDGADRLIGGADDDILNGGAGNDTLAAQSGDDTINGGDGEDIITGLFGDDIIDGGADNDNIFAGAGEDTVFGGSGDDTIRGEGQNDLLHGGDGDDLITGGGNRDTIFGDADNDSLFGQGGLDTIHGGTGNDTISGGTGNDVLFGDEDDDMLLGSSGNDTLNGGTGSDTLFGGDNNDVLFGNEDNDTLSGNDGDDILNGGTGRDILNGGDGSDTFVFAQGYERDSVTGFANDVDTLNILGSEFGIDTVAELLDPANGHVRQVDANTVLFDFGAGDVFVVNGESNFTIADLTDDILLG